jgi:hypothetical protein
MYLIMRRGQQCTEIFDILDTFHGACFWLMNYRYIDECASYWIIQDKNLI